MVRSVTPAPSPSDDKQRQVLQRLRARRGEARLVVDQSRQDLRQQDPFLQSVLRIREAHRQVRRTGIAQLREEVRQSEPLPPAPLQERRRRPDPMKAMPIVWRFSRQLLRESGADLNSTPIAELEESRKNLQYRSQLLEALLEEMQKELRTLEAHLRARRESQQ